MAHSSTPELLFIHHQAYIAKELSKGFTHEQVENWIVQLCDTACKGKSLTFMVRFAELLRNAIREVDTSRKQAENGSPENEVNRFHPSAWKTVKIYRDDWEPIYKCIVRYEKQLSRKLHIEQMD